MLKLEEIEVFYGHVHALKGISMDINEGSLVALIGSNGAGKSTTLKTISGLVRAGVGNVLFEKKRIDRLPPYRILELGICHVPEGREIFPDLTVFENLELGAYRTSRTAKPFKEKVEEIYKDFPILAERKKQLGRTLSGGEQQMLAIARGLMCSPRVLMLDEPSLGLAPIVIEHLVEIIKDLHENGLSILLVEQNAYMALKLADTAYVMETGRIVLTGKGQDLLMDKEIQKAYLGL